MNGAAIGQSSAQRRWSWLVGPLMPVLTIIVLVGFGVSGQVAWLWTLPVTLYVGVPVLDVWIGVDTRNVLDSEVMRLEQDGFYRGIVIAFIPTQYAAIAAGCWLYVHAVAGPWAFIGLVLTVGGLNGLGINTAHELGHKRGAADRWLAKFALAPAAYGHFFVEHNRGHHRHVATAHDPASARMGESLWRFLPRTIAGSLRSAWRIEAARMRQQGRPVFGWGNDNLSAWAISLALFTGLVAWLGWGVLPFFVAQAVYAAYLLETVNYIEHYGLLRDRRSNGSYEACRPAHSWNSNFLVSNLVLYHLQRHSDHHANPTRSYQALRHFDDSPQLPSGYTALILLALVPPLWFRVMDPAVARHFGGDITRANLAPHARARLMRRYAAVIPPSTTISAPLT